MTDRLRTDASRLSGLQPEFALPYLVFLLAHREDFGETVQDLQHMEG